MNFFEETPLFFIPKISFLYEWESQILGKDRWKSRVKTIKKLSFLQGNQGQLFQFCPEMIEAPFFKHS